MMSLTGVQGGHLQCASRPQQHCNHASAMTRNMHSSRRILESRAQVASTQTVTTEEQAQPKARGWAPWRVLSPFGKKQKQQVEQLATISAEELRQLLVAEQEVPLVVIFSATWCGPCKIMVQRLESLMQTMGPQGIKAVKIDTDADPELASELKVHKLPTLYFVGRHPSNPAAHFTGLLPEHVTRDLVENRSQYLGTDIHKAVSV